MSSAGLSIGELVGTVSLNDQFSGPINGVAKALGLSSESFKAITGFAGLAAGAMVGATSAIIALGIHGADVADVSGAFDQLTTAAGSTSEAMLGALQEGTLNTISNFDLMKAANGVLASGMVSTAGDMKTLAAGAKLLADRTGGDTATAFDTLTSAMASGRTAALKQLGVVVDGDSAMQAYANSVHKSVKDLTDHEQATAKSQAVLGALKAALEANGPASVDFGDRINQGKVAVQNFTDNLAVAIANSPALAVAMDAISSGIQSAFGGNNQQAIQTISDYVTKFAIFMVQAAEVGVEVARVISNAWDGLKVLFNVAVGVQIGMLGMFITALGDVVASAAAIPGVGDMFKGVADKLKETGGDLEHLASGFKAQAEAAVDSAGETNGALDKLKAGLEGVEANMRAVEGAQVAVATTATAVKQAHTDAAAALAHYNEVMAGLSEDNEQFRASWATVVTEIDTTFLGLMNDITMANQTSVDARLTAIGIQHQDELNKLAERQVAYGEMYDGLVALTDEKYRRMTEAAAGHYTTMGQMAEAAGFQTRADMQLTADNALQLYNDMKESGKFSDSELKKAHRDYTDKVKAMDGEKALSATQTFELIANAAKTFIGAVFGKGKVAAIATAIIDTAQAVVKALASAPPPLSYALAAAVGVAGLVQINKIRSTDVGFAQGTPGTSFVDFGRESTIAVHGPEAVINQAQGATLGEVLSGMVRDALDSGQERVVAELRRQGAEAANDRRLLPYRMAQAAQLARA